MLLIKSVRSHFIRWKVLDHINQTNVVTVSVNTAALSTVHLGFPRHVEVYPLELSWTDSEATTIRAHEKWAECLCGNAAWRLAAFVEACCEGIIMNVRRRFRLYKTHVALRGIIHVYGKWDCLHWESLDFFSYREGIGVLRSMAHFGTDGTWDRMIDWALVIPLLRLKS